MMAAVINVYEAGDDGIRGVGNLVRESVRVNFGTRRKLGCCRKMWFNDQ
jgi:hypothetical protein